MVPSVRRFASVAVLVVVAAVPGCGGGDLESDEWVDEEETGEGEEEDVDTSESALADSCNLANACLDASCEQYWDCTDWWWRCVGQRLKRDAACVAN